ncbi:MAG TPA: NAD(P)/FAD-dependent oxidoreductase, partial [Candidatus Solibacter sp.]|nr:NAD(P)/FAD-dependent oxidoreductase [Candidatus Solibacter sp.]
VVVIGGGAAGLMCAIAAGRRGRKVTLIEHNAQLGRKILISGGGRCNFTNLHTTAANFHSRNPHFAKSALARFTPTDFIAMVERHGIAYHEKTLGQLFCDRSSREIVAMLEEECSTAGVQVITGCKVERIGDDLAVHSSSGVFRPESVVIATGGLTVPKIGATPFGYTIARQFGLAVVECLPALVPLTFSAEDHRRFDGLAGVSADSIVRADGHAFRERLLFTHRGLSGPSVLQASSYWRAGREIAIDLLPGVDLASELREARHSASKLEARSIAARHLPRRLADRWFELHGFGKPAAQFSDREIDAIVESLRNWRVRPAGTEGFEKAEVTAGGVDTAELSSQTMESRKQSGLYFIGEVVDVTGQLGGFNFQWAWASGMAAGSAV